MNERPMSRGRIRAAGGSGQPIAAPHLMGSMRPPTSGGFNATANPYSVIRPGTGSTARPGSGMVRTAGTSAPMAGSLEMSHRPVTQQGLAGIQGKMGPGRVVADQSYYLQEVRAKVTEISAEINKMRGEVEQINKDAVRYDRLERTYEEVVKEVREREGELADYNLALDKLRTNTDLLDIQDAHMALRERNDEQRRRVDEVFLERSEHDKAVQQMEQDLVALRERALNNLGPRERQEYMQLDERNKDLEEQLMRSHGEIADVEMRVRAARHALNSDAYAVHSRGMELLRRRQDLLKKKEELLEETSQQLSPEEMRERLAQKVKDYKAECVEAQEMQKQLEERVDALQDEIRTRESELVQARKHASKAQKYEALYERERKMKAFISGFADARDGQMQQKQSMQETIVTMLENISRGISLQQNMPDSRRFSQMRKELSFKNQKMENSQVTLEHVTQERERRRADLEKINRLDEKIPRQIEALRARMDKMHRELETFRDPEAMRAEARRRKDELLYHRDEAAEMCDVLKMQVQDVGARVEQQKRAAESHPAAARLEALQQQMRAQAQNAYQVSSFVRSREREGDYQALKDDVVAISHAINDVTLSSLS